MGPLSIDQYFISMAHLAKKRSNCLRRQVGCILVNSRNHVMATGYNGVPSGYPHCEEEGCKREGCASGQSLHTCMAIHAEQNALLQCRDVYRIKTCYTTTFPCIWCLKLLMNTSCHRIVYTHDYADEITKVIWQSQGGELVQLP